LQQEAAKPPDTSSANQQLSTPGENPPTGSAGGECQRLTNETSAAAQTDQPDSVSNDAAADKLKVRSMLLACGYFEL